MKHGSKLPALNFDRLSHVFGSCFQYILSYHFYRNISLELAFALMVNIIKEQLNSFADYTIEIIFYISSQTLIIHMYKFLWERLQSRRFIHWLLPFMNLTLVVKTFHPVASILLRPYLFIDRTWSCFGSVTLMKPIVCLLPHISPYKFWLGFFLIWNHRIFYRLQFG